MAVTTRHTPLCHRCLDITFDKLSQEGGFTHSETFTCLLESAKNCVLCGLILNTVNKSSGILTNVVMQPMYRVSLQHCKQRPSYCRVDVLLNEASHSKLRQMSSIRAYICSGESSEVTPFSNDNTCANLNEIDWENPCAGMIPIYMDENDPATAHGVPWKRRLPSTTKSSQSFEVLRRWLDTCLHDHPESPPSESTGTSWVEDDKRPRRVIKICHDLRGKIWAQLVQPSPSSNRYATLSYVWGAGSHEWCTTETNVFLRSTIGFSISELPLTLRDSIELTSRLGLEYIWIDSLCIIQDDQKDWAREALKMRHVYAHAILNIAADRGSSSHSGLYNTRSQGLEEAFWAWIPVNNVDEAGVRRNIYFQGLGNKLISTHFSEYFEYPQFANYKECSALALHTYQLGKDDDSNRYNKYNWYAQVHLSTLARRSWAFQEQILPARTIHFTETQLFWKCEHICESEDNLPTEYWKRMDWQDNREVKATKLRELSFPFQSISQEMTAVSFATTWYYEIISAYAGRELTKESDRLPAIAGIGKAFNFYQPGAIYLAGLWSSSLLEGLTWYADPGTIRLQHESQDSTARDCVRLPYENQDYTAPSWSWASQRLKVYFAFEEATVWHCQVISCTVKTMSDDPFDRVVSGTLILEGRLLGIKLIINEHGEVKKSDPEDGKYYMTELVTEPPIALRIPSIAPLSTSKSISVLFLNHAFNMADFLILEQQPGQCVWARIGWARALLEPEEITVAEALHLEIQHITLV